MALLSRLGKLFLSLLAALSALVMIYLAAALLGGVIAGDHADLPECNAVTIGLVAGPIHNDFLLPLDAETRDQFAVLSLSDVPIAHPQAEWLMVGWGARKFPPPLGIIAMSPGRRRAGRFLAINLCCGWMSMAR